MSPTLARLSIAPAPEVLLSEEFQWPDIALPIHGFAVYRTGAAGLEWLNRTIATFTGEVNPGLGTLVVSAGTLAPDRSATASA